MMKHRSAVMSLAVLVVFITTYIMILPAITLDEDTAEKTPGIETQVELTSEDEISAEESQEEAEAEIPEEASEEAVSRASDTDSADASDEAKEDTSDGSGSVDASEESVDTESEDEESQEEDAEPAAEGSGSAAALPQEGELTFDGDGYKIRAEFPKEANIPSDAVLKVTEIEENTKDENGDKYEYQDYCDLALEAVRDADGEDGETSVRQVKLYDIGFVSGGEEVEPAAPVKITITYDKALKANEESPVRAVHFDETKRETKAEVLDAEAEIESGKELQEASFESENFSVYAVVYTVDFSWAADGETYEYSIPGGGCITLSELIEALNIDTDDVKDTHSAQQFLAAVENVEFSDEALAWTGYVEANCIVGKLKDKHGLKSEQSADLTDEQIQAIDGKKLSAGDWALISLKPFDTEEKLTVTMKNGDQFDIKVQDAQHTDITSLLTEVTIKGADKNTDGSYNVFPGKPYTVSLNFSETEQETFSRTGSLTYQLPAGLKIPEASSGTITPSDHSQAEIYSINYTIGTDGMITFTWDVKPGKQADFEALPGVFIGLDINAEFSENASTIDWHGKADVTVDHTHDVGVKKSASYGQDGYMYYTVEVTSTGDNRNISLTDTISGTALTLDQNSITETTNHGATFSNKTDKGFSISIPELKHGEKATITYRAKIDYDELAREAGVEKGKYGSVTTTGNQIKINGTDDNPDNDDAETHANHDINFSSAGKSVDAGHYDESTGKRTMNWQIKANDQHSTKISYIQDAMGEGKDKMNYSGEGITVRVINPDWSEAARYTVPWSQLGVNANSEGWTYRIPDQYKDKNYSFVIDYTTEVDVTASIVPETVKNNVETDYGKGGTEGKADPAPGSKLDMEKSVVKPDIPGGTVTWSITVDVPEGGLDSCVVTDTLPTVSGPQNFTDGFDSSSFDKTRDVAGLIDGEDVTLDTSQDGKVIFTFSKGGHPGLYPVDGGRKVTITLTTTLDEDWMAYEITEDYLRYYNTHTNKAKVVANSYEIEDEASVTVNSTEPSMVKKADSYMADNFHWKEYGEANNLNAWMYRLYLYGISDDTFENGYLEITDTFDDKYLAYYDPENTDVFTNNPNIQQYHQKLTHGSENGNYNDPKDIEATVNGGTITFRIPKSAFLSESGEYDRYYHVSYFLHVKDKDTIQKMDEDALAAGGTLKLKNTATWAYSEPTEVEVEHKIPIISKDYTATEAEENAGIYHFEVKVNEGGDQLGDADYLEVTDSYTNLTIDYATLECDPEDALLSYTHSGNTVKYFIKNGVPVTLRYTASALTDGTFSNTVEVNGQSVTKSGTAAITSRGTTGARETEIKILKHSGENLKETISGVQFELYEYDESYPNNYNPEAKVLDGTYTTGADGMFTIQHIPLKAEDGKWTDHSAKYVLHEVAPPEGYKALPHDYVFTVDKKTANYGEYIYLHDDTLPISNKPVEEDEVTIKVNKLWPDGDADLPELIRVRLYQKDSQTAPSSSAREVDVAEMTRGSDGSWTHTFTGLEPGKAYFVKEDPVEGYTATYSSNNTLGLERSGEINITNTKNEPDDKTTSVTVKKKWMNGEDEITEISKKSNLSATVELVRYRAEKPTATVHFYHVKDAVWTLLSEQTIPQAAGVEFSFNASSTYAGGMGVYSAIDTTKAAHESQGTSLVSGKPGQANGSNQSITVDTEGYEDIYVVWQYSDVPTISGFEVTNEGTYAEGSIAAAQIDPTYTEPEEKTLNRENGWRATFSELPVSGIGSDDGKAYAYTYGIRETGTSDSSFAFDAYSVDTFDGEGSNNATVAVESGSTVTVTNKKAVTDFDFEKEWLDISGQKIDWGQDIQVTVGRNKGDGSQDESFSLRYNITKAAVENAAGGTVEFAAAGGADTDPKLKLTITTEGETKKYSFQIKDLPDSGEDGSYTYYVKETNAKLVGYLAPSYTNSSAPTGAEAAFNHGTIVNQQEGGYELPSTGGSGTTWIYILGTLILTFAGITLAVRLRGRKSRI